MLWTSIATAGDGSDLFVAVVAVPGTGIYRLRISGDLELYDPTTDTASPLTALGAPFTDRVVGSYDAANGQLIFVGKGDAQAYSISGDTWSSLTAEVSPTDVDGRTWHAGGIRGQRILVVGGYTDTDPTETICWYHITGDEWVDSTGWLPDQLAELSGVWIAHRFFAFGAYDYNFSDYNARAFMYDATAETVTELNVPDYDNATAGMPAVGLLPDGRIIIAGGHGDGRSFATWLYDTRSTVYLQPDDSDVPFDGYMIGAMYGGRFFVWGNESGEDQLGAVFALAAFDGESEITGEIVARADMTTALATIDERVSATFQEVLNDNGSWSATFLNDDVALDELGGNRFINFFVRGVLAFTGMCEQWRKTIAAPEEESQQVTVWQGGSHLDVLAEVVVYTDLRLGIEPTPENRVFNYASVFYQAVGADVADPSVTWVTATEVCDVATAQSSWAQGIVPWDPEFAPGRETFCKILWASDGTTDQATIGTCYFSQVHNFLVAGHHRFMFACDNVGELNLDGMLMATAEAGGPGEFTNHSTRDVYISAGLHVISGWATNLPLSQLPPTGLNPGGFAWIVYEVDENGQLGDAIAESNNTSVMVEYADEPPGMTPGMVLWRLITEAQGIEYPEVFVRSDNATPTSDYIAIADLVMTFDPLYDSNGNLWPVFSDISVRVGTDYLTVLRELAAEEYIDFSMNPGTLELNAYIHGDRGVSIPIDFYRPTDPEDPSTGNITKWEESGEIVKATAVLVRWGPTWTHRESSAQIALWGRKEALLEIGQAKSIGQARRLADATLTEFGAPRTETNIEFLPVGDVDTPYVGGWGVGDTATVEGDEHRVLSMTVGEDIDTGRATFTPTLNADIIFTFAERLAEWEHRMIPGTLGGRSKLARPAPPVYIPRPTPFALGPAPVGCIEESFDKADSSTLGPDMAWNTFAFTGNPKGIVEVHDLQFALGQTTSPAYELQGNARSQGGVSDPDMITLGIVGNVPSLGASETARWGVAARVVDKNASGLSAAGDNWNLGYWLIVGWDGSNWCAGVFQRAAANSWRDPSSNTTNIAPELFAAYTANTVSPLQPGDELAVKVVGTQSSTVIEGYINGTLVATETVSAGMVTSLGGGITPGPMYWLNLSTSMGLELWHIGAFPGTPVDNYEQSFDSIRACPV